MFGKLVPVPSGAMIPDRDIGKKPILELVSYTHLTLPTNREG